jgi:putative oxidoreductase
MLMTQTSEPRLRRTAPRSVILIRIMVGGVFLSEGLQKFLFSQDVGAGRFERIGLPEPHLLGPLVGAFEVLCGSFLLLGLLTRWAAVPLIAIMCMAIISTKVPILLGEDLGPFRVRELRRYGFWSMAHESRTDFSMLLGSLFLLIVGPGPWSFDACRTAAQKRPTQEPAEP